MSKRTLPDELRSVLLARALEAPAPTDTVNRVLAATVAQDEPSRTSWRRPSTFLLAGVAAVVLAVIVGVGVFAHQHPTSQTAGRANSGAAVRVPGPAVREGQANGNLSGTMGGNLSNGSAEAPQRSYIAPGDTVGLPNPAAPAGLDCAELLPGSRLVVGSATRIRLTGVDHDLYVYDFLCLLSDSQRSASTVAVYAQVAGQLRLQAVLVPATANDQADYMGSSDNNQVVGVQLLTSANTLIQQDFSTSDGVRFSQSSFLVAPACLPSDLTAQIARVDSITGGKQPYAVQFTKQTAGICVLSGYPVVTAAGGNPADLAKTLQGPAGGWGGQVPPIVEMAQGTTVSAMIEPAAQPKCAASRTVTVALPDGGSVGSLPAGLALCGGQLHPIVPGYRGSA